jgi:hypothetical protein
VKQFIEKLRNENFTLTYNQFCEILRDENRSGGKTCVAKIKAIPTFESISGMLATPGFR